MSNNNNDNNNNNNNNNIPVLPTGGVISAPVVNTLVPEPCPAADRFLIKTLISISETQDNTNSI